MNMLRICSRLGSIVLVINPIHNGLSAQWVKLIDRHDGHQPLRYLEVVNIGGTVTVKEVVTEKGERRVLPAKIYDLKKVADPLVDFFIREISVPERSADFTLDTILQVREKLRGTLQTAA